jgi:integrase/recombinase XerC
MPSTLKGWIREFLDAGLNEKNWSPETLRAYESDLAQFAAHLELEFRITEATDLKDVAALHFRSFAASLMKGNENITVARKMSALRTFFKYLKRKGLPVRNWLVAVPSPKVETKLPEYLKIEEVFALLGAPDETTWTGKRDRALFELMYGSGLRVGDMVALYYNTTEKDLEKVLLEMVDRKKTFVSSISQSLEVEADEETQAVIAGQAIWLGIVTV